MALIYADLTYKIIGACMEVHKALGFCLLEAVYAEALIHEFSLRGIPYEREKSIPIIYKGVELKKAYRADLICYDKIIVELKACKSIEPIHIAQVVNYLHLAQLKLGLVVNFGEESLNWERVPNIYQEMKDNPYNQ